MPSEKSSSKGPAKKITQGKNDASKSVSNDSIAGKKRKKKKEADGEKPSSTSTSKKDFKSLTKERSCTLQRKQEGCSISVKKSCKPPTLSHHGIHQIRQNELHYRCNSSTSSLENSKPENKIGRFEECSSSDAMSTDRLAAMELSSCSNSTPSYASSPFRSKTSLSSAQSAGSFTSSSPQTSSALSHASKAHTQTSTNRNTADLANVTVSTNSTSGGTTSHNVLSEIKTALVSYHRSDEIDLMGIGGKATRDSLAGDSQESLRWEQECSDEEREEERIGRYKEKRRKRYLEVLEEHKSKLAGRTRQFYVRPSNSI